MGWRSLAAALNQIVTSVTVVVEGRLDEAIVKRLVEDAGAVVARAIITGGRGNLLARVGRYADAARYGPWLIVCDLDRDPCPPALIAKHIQRQPQTLCFRVAVRTVESWLLADPTLAASLQVRTADLPEQPELVSDPKQVMVQLARRSRRRDVRREIGGPSTSPRAGPRYNELLSDFVRDDWNPQRAAERSDSLSRALRAIEVLATA